MVNNPIATLIERGYVTTTPKKITIREMDPNPDLPYPTDDFLSPNETFRAALLSGLINKEYENVWSSMEDNRVLCIAKGVTLNRLTEMQECDDNKQYAFIIEGEADPHGLKELVIEAVKQQHKDSGYEEALKASGGDSMIFGSGMATLGVVLNELSGTEDYEPGRIYACGALADLADDGAGVS